MQLAIFIIIMILVIICLYILSLKPGKARLDRFKPFERTMIAHRGLYDNEGGIPENSLPAFKRAVDANFGIEMDVQITTDGRLVVFHDETLKRMCGVKAKLTDLSFDELEKYTLAGTDCRIPLFSEVFEIFRNKVPAVIEIKAHGDYIRTAKLLMEQLEGYDGDFCVESFHPRVVHWFRKNRPDVIRGQLSTVFGRDSKAPWIAKVAATNLMTNFYARPDFISYNFKYRNQFSYKLLRRLYKVENVAWTIKSKEELRAARKVFSVFIFDSFDPRELY